MQCHLCLQFRHDGPCEPQPTDLDLLEASYHGSYDKVRHLIQTLPAWGRTTDQQLQLDQARKEASAARDRYLDAGGH